MLSKLYIRNYAIIEEVTINFTQKLNIITGETGAGKSILLGALNLILGERADTSALYNNEKKCIVEGSFNIADYEVKGFFKEHELDYEEVSIIRREISASGKSRAFINDTPVTLNVLKELTGQLVDIHSQHETLELNSAAFQINVIDALAGHNSELKVYRKGFSQYKADQLELEQLKQLNAKAASDLDYYQFQLTELQEVMLEGIDQEELESELKTLNNAEDIIQNLNAASDGLSNGEVAVTASLREVSNLLRSIQGFNKDIAALYERLESSRIELEDIAKEVELISGDITYDPERIQELTDQLNQLYKLQQKHQVQSVSELLEIREDLEQKVDSVGNMDSQIKALESSLAKQQTELVKQATQLHANRAKVAPTIEERVMKILAEVGMPNAVLTVRVNELPKERLNNNGLDEVEFLFTANKGAQPQPIRKVASGGELSRLMLAIKALVAGAMALPTLIFDEIDTGISGEVALRVGNILQQMGRQHQLICITHLPQIAGKGSSHFFVYKDTDGQRTKTHIRELDENERLLEIAKMLSGEDVSEAALANARELLK